MRIGLEVSAAEVAQGALLAAALRLDGASDRPVAALQGTVRFDPARLEYVGQRAAAGVVASVNERSAGSGLLRIAISSVEPLPPRTFVLVFRGVAPGRIDRLELEPELAVTADLQAITGLQSEPHRVVSDLVVPAPDAPSLLAADLGSAIRPSYAIGTPGQVYGDVNGDGAVNGMDVLLASNAAVGLRSIVGDAFVVANVAPTNLPGLGESSDPNPPGRNGDGSTSLNVLDVALISRAAVGASADVVGQVVPAERWGPRLEMTPGVVNAALMTTACQTKTAASGAFQDPATAAPWPECVDDAGRPMVVQYCAYYKDATAGWIPVSPPATPSRCQGELLQYQRGGL
jgi:hypothetical protein